MYKKTILFLTIFTVFLSTCVLSQEVDTAFAFSHGPYLQEVKGDGATLLFTTNKPSFSWVEVIDEAGNTQNYYNLEHGMKMANNTFHTIRLTGLNPASEYAYRLFSKEITQFHPYSVIYGDSIQSAAFRFSTLDPSANALTFIELSDMHGNNDKLESLLQHADVKSAEMVIYAGDMMDYFDKEEQPFYNFIDRSVELFASEKPFWMVRGNHETRGQFSRDLFRYFPREDGRYYYAFRQGPVFFIFLDSGEDKADEHPVYAGLNNFDDYREQQAAWLREVAMSDEFINAPYRIVVSHIPPLPDGWYAEKHITKTWLPILNDAGIDLMLAGHLHEYKYFPQNESIYAFPLLIGSNNSASRISVDDEGIKVKVVNAEGSTIDEMVFSNGKMENKGPENLIISPTQTLSKEKKDFRDQVYNWSVEVLKGPAKDVKAHPSANHFPGEVAASAKRTSKVIHFSHTPPDEHLENIIQTLRYSNPFRNTMYSTGMYAAPGEAITVNIPKHLKGRVQVQIGCHTDNLNAWVAAKQDWRRMPLIWNSFDIEDRKIEVANPFGGLIYITCNPKEEAWSGDITIKNGVEAPYYVHGKTTPEEWKEMQQSGAPWGEMATENIIVTIPTSALKQISNPEENMALWDKVIGAEMELAQLPMPFYRAQRLVTDVHIGGGYMHSGYPIMIHHCPEVNLVSEDIMIEPQKLTEASGGGANWGFFHEIGHNMQNLDWVFDGTTEVSVNFFSLYVFDTIVGTREGAHTGVSPENTQKMMETYFAEGADFDKWKKSPFLGLILFRQIQADFGWDVFKDTFTKYHAFKPDQRPKNNQEKRDVLIGFLSESAQRDFTGFFEAWGIPVSEVLKNELNKYDSWMPESFPPKATDIHAVTDLSHEFTFYADNRFHTQYLPTHKGVTNWCNLYNFDFSNANLLILLSCDDRIGYVDKDLETISNFLDSGGGVVVFGSENSRSQNQLLKTFGAEFTAAATIPLKPSPRIAQTEIEGSPGSALTLDNRESWDVLITDADENAVLARKKIGKGTLLVSSRSLAGSHPSAKDSINKEMWRPLLLEVASGKAIDTTREFKGAGIEDLEYTDDHGTFKLSYNDYMKPYADAMVDVYKRSLPHIENRMGVPLSPGMASQITLLATGGGGFSSGTVVALAVWWGGFPDKEDSMIEFLTHESVHSWVLPFPEVWNEPIATYVGNLVMMDMGHKEEALRRIKNTIARASKYDPDMKLYDIEGNLSGQGKELSSSEKNNIHWGKTYWVFEQLRAENPDFMADYFKLKRKYATKEKITQYDMDNSVALLSMATGRDLFAWFNEHGIKVDKSKAEINMVLSDQ